MFNGVTMYCGHDVGTRCHLVDVETIYCLFDVDENTQLFPVDATVLSVSNRIAYSVIGRNAGWPDIMTFSQIVVVLRELRVMQFGLILISGRQI